MPHRRSASSGTPSSTISQKLEVKFQSYFERITESDYEAAIAILKTSQLPAWTLADLVNININDTQENQINKLKEFYGKDNMSERIEFHSGFVKHLLEGKVDNTVGVFNGAPKTKDDYPFQLTGLYPGQQFDQEVDRIPLQYDVTRRIKSVGMVLNKLLAQELFNTLN